MKMYRLVMAGHASRFELEEYYTLDEALKLYALWSMDRDIEHAMLEESKKKNNR